jgi:hypothetical protein
MKKRKILLLTLVGLSFLTVSVAVWSTIDRLYSQELPRVDQRRISTMTKAKRARGGSAESQLVGAADPLGRFIVDANPADAEAFPFLKESAAALRVAPVSRTKYFQPLENFKEYTVQQWHATIKEVSKQPGGMTRVKVMVAPRIRSARGGVAFVRATFVEIWTWNGNRLEFGEGAPAAGSDFAIFVD